MSSNAYDVHIPATEIQVAEAIRASDPDVADVIRRLAFQRDVHLGLLDTCFSALSGFLGDPGFTIGRERAQEVYALLLRNGCGPKGQR